MLPPESNLPRLSLPLKFIAAGGANTASGLIMIYLCKWAGFADSAANATGYIAGLIISFYLNKQWTFKYSGSIGPVALRFLMVFGVAYLANLLTVLSAIHFTNMSSFIAQALGVPVYTVAFYTGARYFAFRQGQSGVPISMTARKKQP